MAAATSSTFPALTAKAIEHAPPGELRDGAAPGLCIRVSPTGARVFRWYVTSARRVITIGRWSRFARPGHVTLQEARVWLERLKAAHHESRLSEVEAELQLLRPTPARAPRVEDAAVTVADVAADFLRFIERERKRPEQARRPIDCDILPALGDRPIRLVTAQDCRRVVEAVVARGAPTQAGVVLAILKQLFNFALERGDVDANPAERFRNPRVLGVVQNVCQRYLSAEEIAAFWRALDAYRGLSPTVRNGLKLLLLTGVRSGELLQAREADVDLKARTWTVPVAHQKLTRARERTARPFVVPLAPMAAGLFEELLGLARSVRSPFVMASFHPAADGGPIEEKALNHAMRRLFEGKEPLLKFEGDRPTPHDLRRTLRSHVGESLGVPWHIAERLLNHSLGKIATTYDVGDYLAERRAALERWEEFVGRLVDPELANVVPLARGAR
jgi:integrase